MADDGVGLMSVCGAALAQDADFQLTYHVERTAAALLNAETCGQIAAATAAQAGLRTSVQSDPGQLVVVSGGAESQGAFVVHCIVVGDTTVSVVQGIDYRARKAAMGKFADDAAAALMDAVR